MIENAEHRIRFISIVRINTICRTIAADDIEPTKRVIQLDSFELQRIFFRVFKSTTLNRWRCWSIPKPKGLVDLLETAITSLYGLSLVNEETADEIPVFL